MNTCTSRRVARHHQSDGDVLLHVAHTLYASFDDVDPADETAPSLLAGIAIDADDIGLHLANIREHPATALREFTAPAEWHALALVSNGWASTFDEHARRPRVTEVDRHRVRMLHLVARTGASIALFGSGAAEPRLTRRRSTPTRDVGQIDDYVRRALDIPTAPPPPDSIEFWASWWIDRVFEAAASGALDRARWPAIARLHPLHDVIDDSADPCKTTLGTWAVDHLVRAGEIEAEAYPWSRIREATVDGTGPLSGMAPSFASWMDDGMFARTVLGAFAPLDELLADLSALLEPVTYHRVVGTLDAWGLGSASS